VDEQHDIPGTAETLVGEVLRNGRLRMRVLETTRLQFAEGTDAEGGEGNKDQRHTDQDEPGPPDREVPDRPQHPATRLPMLT
jgi:hypothetical protein